MKNPQIQDMKDPDPAFEALLHYLKQRCNCDLTGYKRSTLMRRFQYRMQTLQLDSYESYLDYLHQHPAEYQDLLNDVLINFTSFFRDREAWNYIAAEIIPKILANKQPDQPIKVWSAGCATGQEIFSLQMLMAEALGLDTCLQDVQYFATDRDEDVLRQARKGTFNALDVADVPASLLEKYFEQTQGGYVFCPPLRKRIIFGHQDLAKDAPMSKIDLLLCRNVLIYFNLEVQAAILTRFHFSLKQSGFLFLGKTEAAFNHRHIFVPVNMKQRIFSKGQNLRIKDYLAIISRHDRSSSRESSLDLSYFLKTAFESSPMAQISVDRNGFIITTNEQANRLFGHTLKDHRTPLEKLSLGNSLGKLIGSHTAIKSVYQSNSPIVLKSLEWWQSGSCQYFNVAIAPVFNLRKIFLGVTLTFIETTVPHDQQTVDVN